MPRFVTNAPLSIKGDRIEKGTEIEIADELVASLDPADITPVSDVPVASAEPVAPVSIEDMSAAQLKERAKELGLSTSGSKADLQERIALHLAEADEESEG